jgi:glycine amidinotransferase
LGLPLIKYSENAPIPYATFNKINAFVQQAKTRPEVWKWLEKNGGTATDPDLMKKVSVQIEELCRVLEAEGVRVKRLEVTRWDLLGTFRTPHYEDGGNVN